MEIKLKKIAQLNEMIERKEIEVIELREVRRELQAQFLEKFYAQKINVNTREPRCKAVQKWLKENNIPYQVRTVTASNPLTSDEIMNMICLAEDMGQLPATLKGSGL